MIPVMPARITGDRACAVVVRVSKKRIIPD
jgi:hypothetical protein